ncbi:MAG: DUF3794 domain-containing protein [Acutalibacteraceae bacterium]|nr:DUF3794 domain-containing protein [Acutalibacteraceae bacterium]
MNYPIKTDGFFVCKTIFNETREQTVDADFALPDYCPDIQKILKCRIDPHIETRNIVGDRIEIEGTGTVKIIYIDAIKMAVRCTEQSYPFSISENLREAPQNPAVQTDIKVNYLNCRALSPRRLNLHGAFSVSIKVLDKCEERTVTHIKGTDIQQKKKSVDYSYLHGITQRQFSVTETLEPGQNHSPVQSVIRSDIRAVKGDCKISDNKLIYKGDLLVKLVYLSDLDSGKLESMDYSIPFSQAIELDGNTENSTISLRTEVMSYNIALRTEIGFDDPLPVLSAKLCITALVLEKRDTTVITDCYSTLYRTEPEFSEVSLPVLKAQFKESIVDKVNVDFTESTVSKVTDVWCEKGSSVCTQKDGKNYITGKYNICVLAADSEGNTIYTERSSEYTHALSADILANKPSFYTETVSISSSYRICSERRIEVRTELLVSGELYDEVCEKGLSSVSADKDKLRKDIAREPLVLYYAKAGEDVWDIARSYCTGADTIKSENELDADTLSDDRLLLITC